MAVAWTTYADTPTGIEVNLNLHLMEVASADEAEGRVRRMTPSSLRFGKILCMAIEPDAEK